MSKCLLCFCLGLLLVMLSACDPGPSTQTGYVDQDVRREVFFECLKVVPAGPQSTRYNDWSEVVSECGDQARMISLRGYIDTRAAEKLEKKP